VLSGKLCLRFACKLEWTDWLLSKWKHLRRNRQRCSSHNGDCVSATTDGHCLCEPSTTYNCCQQSTKSSARRLLRNDYNGWTRSTQGSAGRLWNNSDCSGSTRPESVWYRHNHLCGDGTLRCCKNVQQVIVSEAVCFRWKRRPRSYFYEVMSYEHMWEHDGLDGL
jgi:hypothetical protein